MRQSKDSVSHSRAVTVVREKSDLSNSRRLDRRNEATARASYERLGSLSRAVSVDAYPEGQMKTNVDRDLDVLDSFVSSRRLECMPRSSV